MGGDDEPCPAFALFGSADAGRVQPRALEEPDDVFQVETAQKRPPELVRIRLFYLGREYRSHSGSGCGHREAAAPEAG